MWLQWPSFWLNITTPRVTYEKYATRFRDVVVVLILRVCTFLHRFALRKILFNQAVEDFLISRSLVNIQGSGRGWEWGCRVPLSYASEAKSCTYFGSGQAVMQMITTSNKLSILFLLKGKTILYQSFVRILLAQFFLLMLRFQWEPKNRMEMYVARLRS